MRQIHIDHAVVKGAHRKGFRACVGAGRAALGLRADFQKHLTLVHTECGFERVRFHGLFHDDMAIYRRAPDRSLDYNWMYADALHDMILDTGMKPFVELGFMPSALASGDQTVFDWRANVTPPASYDAWHELVHRTVKHFTERYGRSEVETWHFEVWNEPNHPAFFTGDMDAYFRLYEAAARAIKSICQGYRVGGPSTAGCEWVPQLIEFCHRRDIPLDFVTTHTYGVSGHIDEFGVKQLIMLEEPGPIVDPVRRIRKEVESSAMPALPVHITEWGPTFSSRDPYNDIYPCAAYVLSKLKGTEDLAESMSYWTFSDVFEETGPPPCPFHGGFGLVNVEGLRKPAFFAYQFLHQLGDEELACSDPDTWACRSDRGVQVLFWNYTPHDQDAPNRQFYGRDLPSRPAGEATIVISGLPAGTYEVAVHEIGYRRNDVYTDYLDLNSPTWLSRESRERLAERNSGKSSFRPELNVAEGQSRASLPPLEVRENHVFLILLTSKA